MSRLLKPLSLVALLLALAAVVAWRSGGRPDRLASARAAIDRRDFTAARQELDAHLARRAGDRAVLLLAAQTARRADDGPAAEDYRNRYLAAGGDPAEADWERALVKLQGGQVGDASRLLTACAAKPDDPATYLTLEALARGLVIAGPASLAIPCLDLWLSRPLTPADRVQGLVWRGRVLEEWQDLSAEAATDYRRALAIDAGHTEARLRLARFLVRDQPAEALAHFQRLEQESPGRPEVLLGLARTHHHLGNLDQAAGLLERLEPARSSDPDVLVAAGALALDRGRPAEAEPLLRRAVTLAPRARDPNVQLLRCLRELGDANAIREQEAVVKGLADDPRRPLANRGKP